MPKKPTSEMRAVLASVIQQGGSKDLHELTASHDLATIYRCVRHGWLRWVWRARRYDITETGRTAFESP